MNEQLRKLYLMTTRNSDFITQRNISKYLPLKNGLVNYHSILELNNNLAQVEIAFRVKSKDSKHQGQPTRTKSPNKDFGKQYKRNKSRSDFNNTSLLEVYKSNKVKRKPKNHQSSNKLKSNDSITIIENQPESEAQTQQNRTFKSLQKPSKKPINHKNDENRQEFQIHESELDAYIDQYLHQLMQQKNVNIRKEIQSDRKLFIKKAIQGLKKKIKLQKSNEKQRNQGENMSNSPKSQQKIKENPQSHLDTHEIEISRKPQILKKKPKQKTKSKSTQLIPSSGQKGSMSITKQQSMLPSLKTKTSSALAQISHRSIYNSTPAASFITKIGKTFYLNELNNLNKTIQLEARNRERAQRFFRRKLMNIERQHEKLVGEYYYE